MSFRTVYGYQWSENGWRMCNIDECDQNVIPGTGISIPLRKGSPNTIMKAFACRFNKEVEPLAGGAPDEGGWTSVNDVGNSNHLAGTAMDLDWRQHVFRVAYSGYTQTQINSVRRILADFDGTIWWGEDWQSPKDSMHFQMNFPEGDARNNEFATRLQNGLFGIYGNGSGGTAVIPNPPLVTPAGTVPELLQVGSSGQYVKNLQAGMNKVFSGYSKLTVDGDYGPLTAAVVSQFQTRAGLVADGIVGPNTATTLKKYGVKVFG